ncbi:MAG TPA: DinB family protein [Candidatus Bathyarchaeia archaeon]|nr:DinB family protein [Candidatus Bathyarchaeia archaeon]
MFTRIEDFLKDWAHESASTSKIFEALTDASLSQAASKDDRSLGRVAWHIVTSIPDMLGRTGLPVKSAVADAPMPVSAVEMAAAYKTVAEEAAQSVRDNWTDDTLATEDDMYGMMWPRGVTLEVLIRHEIHHRAQITVLMRLAGLKVPGIYGPAREEWSAHGMPAPEI